MAKTEGTDRYKCSQSYVRYVDTPTLECTDSLLSTTASINNEQRLNEPFRNQNSSLCRIMECSCRTFPGTNSPKYVHASSFHHYYVVMNQTKVGINYLTDAANTKTTFRALA